MRSRTGESRSGTRSSASSRPSSDAIIRSPESDSLRPSAHRIVVALANPTNQRLLGETLATRYEISNSLDGSPADLYIVDGITLHREWARLRNLRELAEPHILPVLLASDRGDIGLLTRELWRVVDDVIMRPIEKAELRVRLEALLRARRLSLSLTKMSTLYQQERSLANRLQAAGLPHAFPVVPGLRFDAFYQPGSDEALIGGDWYDAFRLPDGRVVLTIGDVSGSGIDAAITMANVRQSLRSVAYVHPEPAVMLAAADRTLALDDNDRQVTAFVGIFDPVTGFFGYASAGHPPAILCDGAGGLCELSTGGIPLGVDPRTDRTAESVAIGENQLLVVHTDGLTEATHDIIAGELRLHDALRSREVLEATDPAEALRRTMLPDGANDDVAIVTIRIGNRAATSEQIRRWRFHADDSARSGEVRGGMVAALATIGFSERARTSAEVVYAELIGNVVRYAPGETDVVLDTSGSSPVLHVLDHGSGFRLMPRLPYDALSERGRGLYIVSEYSEEFQVLVRREGGSHASAVLRR